MTNKATSLIAPLNCHRSHWTALGILDTVWRNKLGKVAEHFQHPCNKRFIYLSHKFKQADSRLQKQNARLQNIKHAQIKPENFCCKLIKQTQAAKLLQIMLQNKKKRAKTPKLVASNSFSAHYFDRPITVFHRTFRALLQCPWYTRKAGTRLTGHL